MQFLNLNFSTALQCLKLFHFMLQTFYNKIYNTLNCLSVTFLFVNSKINFNLEIIWTWSVQRQLAALNFLVLEYLMFSCVHEIIFSAASWKTLLFKYENKNLEFYQNITDNIFESWNNAPWGYFCNDEASYDKTQKCTESFLGKHSKNK